jgi:hypothetical protein
MVMTRPQKPRPLRLQTRPKRSEPVWHCPLEEPATPRLRKQTDKQLEAAIGFHRFESMDDGDAPYARRK